VTFDNSDLRSFAGPPKPIGSVDLVLNGLNGLIDNLVSMGLTSAEEAMGVRMMLAAFTAPAPSSGQDVMKSTIEFTPEGHTLANGQRVR